MSRDSFATRWNVDAIEDAYERWQHDPDSVSPDWRLFFEGFELGGTRRAGTAASSDQNNIVRLIQAYRDFGHFLAGLDPLSEQRASHPHLDIAAFGFSEADLDRTFDTSVFKGLPRATLRQLVAALKETYSHTIGVEYTHIQDASIREWLEQRMEPRRNRPELPRRQKLRTLMQLHFTDLFEKFLHHRYIGQKRFSLEGAETLIPMLDAVVEKAPELGIAEFVMGMAHRGRLNVLANI